MRIILILINNTDFNITIDMLNTDLNKSCNSIAILTKCNTFWKHIKNICIFFHFFSFIIPCKPSCFGESLTKISNSIKQLYIIYWFNYWLKYNFNCILFFEQIEYKCYHLLFICYILPSNIYLFIYYILPFNIYLLNIKRLEFRVRIPPKQMVFFKLKLSVYNSLIILILKLYYNPIMFRWYIVHILYHQTKLLFIFVKFLHSKVIKWSYWIL